jgi:hypothetical protein
MTQATHLPQAWLPSRQRDVDFDLGLRIKGEDSDDGMDMLNIDT